MQNLPELSTSPPLSPGGGVKKLGEQRRRRNLESLRRSRTSSISSMGSSVPILDEEAPSTNTNSNKDSEPNNNDNSRVQVVCAATS